MIYKCTGDLHIWGWTDFKEAIKGDVVNYDYVDGIINSIDYEVEGIINKKACKEYGVSYRKIN